MCYAAVLGKVIRIYYIFHNPTASKKVHIFNLVHFLLTSDLQIITADTEGLEGCSVGVAH